MHTEASLEEMYSVGWGKSTHVCVRVFSAFVVLHLYVHTAASQEAIYNGVCGRSIYLFVLCASCFRNSPSLSVHSGLTARNVQCGLGQEYMYMRLCASSFVILHF